MTLVIDTGAIAHAIRRWLWRRRAKEASNTQCVDCGKEMTRDEIFHYVCTCERCEGIAHERGYG